MEIESVLNGQMLRDIEDVKQLVGLAEKAIKSGKNSLLLNTLMVISKMMIDTIDQKHDS